MTPITADKTNPASTPRREDIDRRSDPFLRRTELTAPGDAGTKKIAPPRSQIRRVKYLTLWTRQLYVLVKTGTPLAQAMHAVERQAPEGPWRQVLTDLRRQIDEGLPLSEAMSRHPAYFDPICRNLIAAGESAGALDRMLERLSRLTRWQLRVRRSVVGALIYPSLLLSIALGVIVTLICAVLPRFEGLFEKLDAPLPPTTKWLIMLSELFRGQWWALLIAAVVAVVGARFFMRSEQGGRTLDRWAVGLPYTGALVRSFLTARFARLLGELIESKVPIIESLRLTRQAAGNRLYAELIEEAEEAVIQGDNMSSVLARSSLVSPSLAEAVRHAESNGQVGPVLVDMADFMDQENESLVRNLTSILEPVILVLLGGLVAFIALSMFVPLFDLTSMA